MKIRKRGIATVAVTASLLIAYGATSLSSANAEDGHHKRADTPVQVTVFAPGNRDNAGISGTGWFVDLAVHYDHGLAAAAFTGLQLTGPLAHNNTAPFPGTFSTGQDDRLPGLVVLSSTTNNTLPGFSGPGTNLANLFNLTGVTNRSGDGAEIWDTWIVGAPIAGQNVDTILTVAVVADLNHDGIYNDAPNVVPDADHDGKIDAGDLQKFGVASNIVTIHFHINAASG